MEELQFDVSAKTARLIGRENIADVDGAVIELVKNAYDADASCVFIKFYMPFPNVPLTIDKDLVYKIFSQEEIAQLTTFYKEEKDCFVMNDESKNSESELRDLLFVKNKIVIVDNGIGMTQKVLKTAWMNIGTDNKEKEYSSKKGRIKTGAKGIGRFALDKLSKNSKVITKSDTDDLYQWQINWEDFANVKLLSEVKAKLVNIVEEFEEVVKNYVGKEFEKVKEHNWATGTIIELTPTREPWNDRLFSKVNNNLKSINPLGNVDKFDVFITNEYYPDHNYIPQAISIIDGDYDYKFTVDYDGKDKIELKLLRNEIDVLRKSVDIVDADEVIHKVNLDEFWSREKFKPQLYSRESYNKEIVFNFTVKDFYNEDNDIKIFKDLGSFHLNAYFIKNNKIDTGIVKEIAVRRRKSLLRMYSGIKIYRDNFKVRPYGDDGPMYDWLNLGKRSQQSPAAVSHEKGSWRVEPYQLIGSLSIGRLTNPNLTDMANREGIALNDSYYLLVDFLQQVIGKFEYDRQYVFREFALWKKQKTDEFTPKKSRLIKKLKKDKNISSNPQDENGDYDVENADEFSKDDYKNVLKDFIDTEDQQLKTRQVLMMYSSSGILTNTFTHEIQRLGTDFGSRMQHLNVAVKRIIKPEQYDGDEDFNPFKMISDYKEADELLSSWISVVMDGLASSSFNKQQGDIYLLISEIANK